MWTYRHTYILTDWQDRQTDKQNLKTYVLQNDNVCQSKLKTFYLTIRFGKPLWLDSKCGCFLLFLQWNRLLSCWAWIYLEQIMVPSAHQTNYKQIKGTDLPCFSQLPLIDPTNLAKNPCQNMDQNAPSTYRVHSSFHTFWKKATIVDHYLGQALNQFLESLIPLLWTLTWTPTSGFKASCYALKSK